MRAHARTLTLLGLLLLVAFAPSTGSATPRGTAAPVTQVQPPLLAQINGFRAAHGLVPLKLNGALVGAADRHSAQMARLGFFSHNSAHGQACSPRCFRSGTVGENLVWGGPDIGAARAFRLWLSSAPHRANLLNARWREIGLGAVHPTKAPRRQRGG